MSDLRPTKVSLILDIDGFKANLATARAAAGDFGKQLTRSGKENAEAWRTVGGVYTKVGVAAGLAFGIGVKKSLEFEKAMSNVQAATQESAAGMDRLRAAALAAGARTVFSATEAANAVEELSKAGVSTANILGGALDASLNLASAGGIGVAEAAGIAATQLEVFNLRGRDASHVADLLAAGAGKAMGDVTDLAQALKYAGPSAQGLGVSIEETTGVLALFASQGQLADTAGTSFRSTLLSLTAPSAIARKEIERLGINVYDAQGNFKGMAGVAGELSSAYQGMTQQQREASLGIIFGNESINAARILYNEGAKGIENWTDRVNDAEYASRIAKQRLDNLSGDIEGFTGALDTGFIKAGSGANDLLRTTVQAATNIVNTYGALPDSVQGTIGVFTGVAGAVGLAGGAFMLGVPKVVEYRAALQTLGTTGQLVGRALKGASIATAGFAVGIAAVEGLNAYLETLGATDEELQNVLKTGKDADEILTKAFQGKSLGINSTLFQTNEIDNYKKRVQDLADVEENWWARFQSTDKTALNPTLIDLGKQFADLASVDLPAAQAAFTKLSAPLEGNQALMLTQLNTMGDYKEALRGVATEHEVEATDQNLLRLALGETVEGFTLATDATNTYTPSIGQAGATASDATGNLKALVDALTEYNKEAFAGADSSIALEQSIDDVKARLGEIQKGTKGYNDTLKISTQAGRDNMAALLDLASAANQAAADQLALTGSTEEANKKVERGRAVFIAAADAMGVSKARAKELADEYIGIPDEVTTEFKSSGLEEAQKVVDDWLARLSKRVVDINIRGTLPDLNGSTSGSGRPGLASGGAVRGPGTSTSDSIDAKLSDGEHVIPANEVRMAGGQAGVYAWRSSIRAGAASSAGGGAGGMAFAGGGAVSTGKLVSNVQAARNKENQEQRQYDGVKASDKSAKAKAKAELTKAQKATAKAEQELSDRRAADAAYTDTYKDSVAVQGRDAKYYEQRAKAQPNTAAGRKVAQDFRDQASDALLSSAEANVQALRDVMADPNASKKVKDRAKKDLKSQKADLDRLLQKQAQDELDAQAAAISEAVAADRESFAIALRRGDITKAFASGGGLSYVDQLHGLARSGNYTDEQAAALNAQADSAEATLLQFQDAADEAAKHVEDLTSQFEALKNQVASTLKAFDLSGLLEEQTTTQRIQNADGSISLFSQTTAGTYSASGIDDLFAGKAADNQRFADKLQRLSGRIPADLLTYIAGQGIKGGEPMADALLNATDAQLASITSNYATASQFADIAGGIVADSAYGKDLADWTAKNNALQATIAGVGTEVIATMKALYGGQGFAGGGQIFGPGSSTSDSIPIRASKGEHMLSAADVRAMGGQGAVYSWRESLHTRTPGYADGGAIQWENAGGSYTYSPSFHVDKVIAAGPSPDQVTNSLLELAGRGK